MIYHSTPKKVYFHIKSSMYIFITLFVTAPNFKQSRILSGREWINKLLSIYTMEYYSAVERNTLLIHATTWMSLKVIILHGRSQTSRVLTVAFHLYKILENKK